MAIEAVETGISEDDLLRLGTQDKWIEIVNGEIVEMNPVGLLHHLVAGNVYDILGPHIRANGLGIVFIDGLIYVLQSGTKDRVRQSRVPDISFVRNGCIPKNFKLSRPFPGAPDLAIEVISPDETADS